MSDPQMGSPSRPPLRLFCVEDNALLVMHMQVVIENAGHIFAGSAARFDDVRSAFSEIAFDLALVDIDLADGRTGGLIAKWLHARGRPSLFLSGQDKLMDDYADVSLGAITKPVSEDSLGEVLHELGSTISVSEC